jgi:hypothetical protein
MVGLPSIDRANLWDQCETLDPALTEFVLAREGLLHSWYSGWAGNTGGGKHLEKEVLLC